METIEEMKLSNSEYDALTSQAGNYRTILRFLKASGFDGFLSDNKRPPIDLLLTPNDKIGGESVNLFLKAIADECNKMEQKIKSLSEALVDTSIQLAKAKRTPKSLLHRIKEFLF